MKILYLLLIPVLLSTVLQAQTFCNLNGDIAIFSNYDGGVLEINVDQNIPNLKIGIVSYEDDSVIISGPYASNVTRVIYAGYFNTNHVHCATAIEQKGVYGVDTSIVDINFIPAATLSNPYGYLYIICNTSCVLNASQGGCNTADQIEDYFFNQFGSNNLLFHLTQYGCWIGKQSISSGGNCCATTVGVNEVEEPAAFSIYPNPAHDLLNVECKVQNAELKVYDLTGRVVVHNQTLHCPLSSVHCPLSTGLYLVRIEAGQKMYQQKLVIE